MKKLAGLLIITALLYLLVPGGVIKLFTNSEVSCEQKSAAENPHSEEQNTAPDMVEPKSKIFQKDKQQLKKESSNHVLKEAASWENIHNSTAVQKEEVRKLIQDKSTVEELNKETDNLNILFLGTDKDKLLMAAVYSINHQAAREKYSSGAVFFPASVRFEVEGQMKSLQEIYESKAVEPGGELKEILEKAAGIKIAYSVEIDKAILEEVNKVFQPITIDGKKMDLENLFEICIKNNDQEILNELLAQLASPAIYFYHLPRFVLKFNGLVKTDFPVSAENLWFHYKIMRKIDTGNIRKVIAPEPVVPEQYIKNIFYEITVNGK